MRRATRATVSGDAPYGVRQSAPIVICAMSGFVGSTARAARMACSISSRSEKVSRMIKSTPPSTSPSICSRKMAHASSLLVGPNGSRRTPSGPTAPATSDAVAGRGAGDARGGAIELAHLILQPVLRELDAVRAEAVRLDDVGAGVDVLLVHLAHELRRADVQLVVTLIDEYAFAIEHRPHRPVEHDDGVGVEHALELGRGRDHRAGDGVASPRTA